MTSSDQNKTRPTAPASGHQDVEDTLPESFDPKRFAPRAVTPDPNGPHPSEDQEMAELMRALRESIPYQEEENDVKTWQPDPMRPRGPAGAKPGAAAAAGQAPAPAAEGNPADDDFARLLRSLRESIPDDPEPTTTTYGPEAVTRRPVTEATLHHPGPERESAAPNLANDDQSYTFPPPTRKYRPVAETLPVAPEPQHADHEDQSVTFPPPTRRYRPAEIEPDPVEAHQADHEEQSFTFPPPTRKYRPAETEPDPVEPRHADHEDQHLEAPAIDTSMFADLLSSLHDSVPRRPDADGASDPIKEATANRDRFRELRFQSPRAKTPVADPMEDDEEPESEPRRASQVWKIALILGGASALGLAVALINPFGDSPPYPPSPVVVPSEMQNTAKPQDQVAQNSPVVVPTTPTPDLAPPSHPIALLPSKPTPVPKPVDLAPAAVEAPPPVAVPPPKPAPPPVAVPPPAPEPAPVAVLPPAPEPPPPAAPPPVAALPPVATPPPVATLPAPKPVPPPAEVAAAEPPPAIQEPLPRRSTSPGPRASAPPPIAEKPAPAPVEVASLPPPNEAPANPEPASQASAPPPASADHANGPRVLTVQIGSFQIPENADLLIKDLKKQGFDAYSKDWTDGSGRVWHVVRVGRLTNRSAANALARKLANGTDLEPYILSVH